MMQPTLFASLQPSNPLAYSQTENTSDLSEVNSNARLSLCSVGLYETGLSSEPVMAPLEKCPHGDLVLHRNTRRQTA